ncbi:peptidase U32 family protein [Candidatus Omnitrophota bacterium]
MVKKVVKPELVSPAGDWPSLIAAVESGADSVYFGVKMLNMRNLATNFDIMELPKIMRYLKDNNRKGYLALNVIVMDQELIKVKKILSSAKKASVDAVIVWDMAVFLIAKKLRIRVHLSTQASVSNKEAVLFFAKLGVKRIVLARECSLKDIKAITAYIAKKRLRCEVETFIHGAMCISVSGRCFLSEHSFGKSANRGQCLQPCRREYRIFDTENEVSYLLGKDYVLSAKDLCTISFLDSLVASGINAFKIEGRMKSAEYVRVTTSVYRRAIDAALKGKLTTALKKSLEEELKSVYNRGFSGGFLFGVPSGKISSGPQHSKEKIFAGKVTKFFKRISVAEINILDHPLKVGDTVLFLGKNTPARETKVTQIQLEHQPRKTSFRGERIGVKLPFSVKPNDKVFLWRRRKA